MRGRGVYRRAGEGRRNERTALEGRGGGERKIDETGERKEIYNRNYDTRAPVHPLSPSQTLSYNTARLATLSPFAQNLGRLGQCQVPQASTATHKFPVIAFAPAYYIRKPVTPDQ